MISLQKEVEQNILKFSANRNENMILATSGGIDSMFLLHILNDLHYKNIIVAHINHNLRSEDSNIDASFVKKMSNSYKYKSKIYSVNVSSIASTNKISLELAGRIARYSCLAKLSRKINCSKILTAHHFDDHIETVIINIFRGTGLKGLVGIKPISKKVIDETTLNICRPLLSIRKNDIQKYVSKNKIKFREDKTNKDSIFLRNRVRNELIPKINETFKKDISSSVNTLSKLALMDNNLIENLVKDYPKNHTKLDIKPLLSMPKAQRYRIILKWLKENKLRNCGFKEVEKINNMISYTSYPAKINLPNNIHARRKSGILFLENINP